MENNEEKEDIQEVEAVNTPEMVSVPLDELKEVLAQNREMKVVLGNAMFVIDFIKQNIFDGEIPENWSVGKMSKLLFKLPRIIPNIPENEAMQFGRSLEVVKTKGAELQQQIIKPEPKQIEDAE